VGKLNIRLLPHTAKIQFLTIIVSRQPISVSPAIGIDKAHDLIGQAGLFDVDSQSSRGLRGKGIESREKENRSFSRFSLERPESRVLFYISDLLQQPIDVPNKILTHQF
jgi:hypothetical protein